LREIITVVLLFNDVTNEGEHASGCTGSVWIEVLRASTRIITEIVARFNSWFEGGFACSWASSVPEQIFCGSAGVITVSSVLLRGDNEREITCSAGSVPEEGISSSTRIITEWSRADRALLVGSFALSNTRAVEIHVFIRSTREIAEVSSSFDSLEIRTVTRSATTTSE
jgi:hypothetical protein